MPTKTTAPERPLSIKQQKFCEHIVAGETNAQAYRKAGYAVTNSNSAEACASRLLGKANIRSRIAELRKPQTHRAMMTRDRKRELLREIAENAAKKDVDRIRAIEVDAKLAGHFEPDRQEIELGPKTLLSIKDRAKQVSSSLARRYGKEGK